MNDALFFATARNALFGGKLTTPQVQGLNELLKAAGAAKWPLSWTAYLLATAFHETNATMQPVREKGVGDKNGNGEDDWFEKYDTGSLAKQLGNTPAFDGDGQKWCGRGYPQITGAANYAKIDKALGLNGALTANPDMMLRADIASPATIIGMGRGLFTGKSCADYLPATGPATQAQFTQARRIVNGQDRASDIAAYAMFFQHSLQVAGVIR